jgi:lipid-binding SYLF domain-containing protein
VAAGCRTEPKTEARRETLQNYADSTLAQFKAQDPTVDPFLSHAKGYAVFPMIGKGAAVVGGAYGKGVLYQDGHMIGYCDMTQASVGPQVGGQTYSELIAFESTAALDRFKNNNLDFTANASAIVAETGAAAQAKYDHGVVVFIRAETGLMAEASLAGQKFTYKPAGSYADDLTTAPAD